MKTNYFFTKKISIYSVLGVLALMATSCGSYQNTSYYDNDGVYGSTEKPKQKAETNNSGYYKDYFSSLNKENEQVFTDVEKYSTYNDTLKKVNTNTTTTDNQNATGYASWGSNPDNVTVNVYNNGWGYNNWYGPSWGYYGGGYYGNYWGYNSWYGNSWGYSPSWAWGWNSWYGPSWYGYGYGYGYYPYGYGYNPYGYGYYGNTWAWNNGSLGHTYAHSGGRRNTNFTGSGYGSPNRSMSGNGGRSALGGNRVVGEPSNIPRSYSNTGTPRNSYVPRTNETVSPRSTTPNNNTNYNTPRSYTPSVPSTTTSSPRTYTPSTPRSYDSPRSYTPSGGGSYGGGGGSYGGGGGGRSGGGGGRR